GLLDHLPGREVEGLPAVPGKGSEMGGIAAQHRQVALRRRQLAFAAERIHFDGLADAGERPGDREAKRAPGWLGRRPASHDTVELAVALRAYGLDHRDDEAFRRRIDVVGM